MKRFLPALFSIAVWGVASRAETMEKPWFQRSIAAEKALQVLRASLEPSPAKKASVVKPLHYESRRTLLREASQLAPDNVLLQEITTKALDQADRAASPEEASAALEFGVQKAIDLLAFRPVMEADLPRGFPTPTPVGEIAVKHFPAYRAARTDMNGEGWAFWRLFAHITANRIAMTAPVEVTYSAPASPADGLRKRESMAFLYGDPNTGEPVAGSTLSVVDLPPAQYVSIGMRGDWNTSAIAAAEKHLLRWLEAHADEYKVAGKLRMMGYNSPKVAVADRYFEVEMPIEPLPPKKAPSDKRTVAEL